MLKDRLGTCEENDFQKELKAMQDFCSHSASKTIWILILFAVFLRQTGHLFRSGGPTAPFIKQRQI